MATYMTVMEVCVALGVAHKTFYKKHRGCLPNARAIKGKRGLYFLTSDVRRYAKANGVKMKEPAAK